MSIFKKQHNKLSSLNEKDNALKKPISSYMVGEPFDLVKIDYVLSLGETNEFGSCYLQLENEEYEFYGYLPPERNAVQIRNCPHYLLMRHKADPSKVVFMGKWGPLTCLYCNHLFDIPSDITKDISQCLRCVDIRSGEPTEVIFGFELYFAPGIRGHYISSYHINSMKLDNDRIIVDIGENPVNFHNSFSGNHVPTAMYFTISIFREDFFAEKLITKDCTFYVQNLVEENSHRLDEIKRLNNKYKKCFKPLESFYEFQTPGFCRTNNKDSRLAILSYFCSDKSYQETINKIHLELADQLWAFNLYQQELLQPYEDTSRITAKTLQIDTISYLETEKMLCNRETIKRPNIEISIYIKCFLKVESAQFLTLASECYSLDEVRGMINLMNNQQEELPAIDYEEFKHRLINAYGEPLSIEATEAALQEVNTSFKTSYGFIKKSTYTIVSSEGIYFKIIHGKKTPLCEKSIELRVNKLDDSKRGNPTYVSSFKMYLRERMMETAMNDYSAYMVNLPTDLGTIFKKGNSDEKRQIAQSDLLTTIAIAISKKINRILSGGYELISRAELALALVNLSNAKGSLAPDKYDRVKELFEQYLIMTNKMILNMDQLLDALEAVFRSFNEIAPIDSYITGGDPRIALIIADLTHNNQSVRESLETMFDVHIENVKSQSQSKSSYGETNTFLLEVNNVDSSSQDDKNEQESVASDQFFCRFCGTLLPGDSVFCFKCGKRVSNQ